MAKKKYSDEEVVKMRQMHRLGFSISGIARIFRAPISTVSAIINRRRRYGIPRKRNAIGK